MACQPTNATDSITIPIRTLPKTNAPRTGEGVTPGEIFECVQTIKADFNLYFRLWGDRGWLYEKDPKARYPILSRVLGDFKEEIKEFKFVGKGKLPILSGPSYDNSSRLIENDVLIESGTIFFVNASFQEKNEETKIVSQIFYKLQNGKGWIAAFEQKSQKSWLQRMG